MNSFVNIKPAENFSETKDLKVFAKFSSKVGQLEDNGTADMKQWEIMNNYKRREIVEETNILNQLDLFLSLIDADHEEEEKPIKIDF